MHKPLNAHVTYPNRKKSDTQPTALHDVVVELADGRTETVRLLAVCPDAAIDIVRNMTPERYRDLQRITG